MAGFSDESLAKRLKDLNPSAQMIETVSLWIIHHRKHHAHVVQIWYRELQSAKPKQRLTFLFLANDIIQNSRKKGPEFNQSFQTVIRDSLKIALQDADEKTRQSLKRIVDVWAERKVFPSQLLTNIRKLFPVSEADSSKTKSAERKRKKDATESNGDAKLSKSTIGLDAATVDALKMDLQNEVETAQREPPDAEKLVELIRQLDGAASGDANVRLSISALPSQVADLSLVPKLTDVAEARELAGIVNEAATLLADYNDRLTNELADRKRLSLMTKDFTQLQRDQAASAQAKLAEYKEKLAKIGSVRRELKTHLENLPDLPVPPAEKASAAKPLDPLPSVGDLFNVH